MSEDTKVRDLSNWNVVLFPVKERDGLVGAVVQFSEGVPDTFIEVDLSDTFIAYIRKLKKEGESAKADENLLTECVSRIWEWCFRWETEDREAFYDAVGEISGDGEGDGEGDDAWLADIELTTAEVFYDLRLDFVTQVRTHLGERYEGFVFDTHYVENSVKA